MGRDRTRIERLEQLNNSSTVSDVTGTAPIVITTPSVGVRNVAVTGLSGTNTGDQSADNSTLQLVSGVFSEKDGGTTNAKLANMAAHTVKANITGSAAAPVDSSLSAILDAEVGSTKGMMIARGASVWKAFSAPTADGQLIIADSTQDVYMKWGDLGIVTTGWATVLDLDFSAQGSQTLTTDGNYTIGGLVWTKVNSTNDSTAMAVTNGSGLVITPKSTGSWSSNTRTAPAIELPLSSIIANFDPSFGLRIYFEIASENPAAATDNVVIGIDNMDTTAARIWQAQVFRGWQSSPATPGVSVYNQLSTGIGNTIAGLTLGAGNRTNLFEILGITGSKSLSTAAGGGAWPSPATFVPSVYTFGATSAINSTTNPISFNGMNLIIAGQRSGSGTAYVVTVKRIRVDVRR